MLTRPPEDDRYDGRMPNLGAMELLIILVIVLLVFGGSRLPKLARSLGQAQREFKEGQDERVEPEDPKA